jgi:hypothetical protein
MHCIHGFEQIGEEKVAPPSFYTCNEFREKPGGMCLILHFIGHYLGILWFGYLATKCPRHNSLTLFWLWHLCTFSVSVDTANEVTLIDFDLIDLSNWRPVFDFDPKWFCNQGGSVQWYMQSRSLFSCLSQCDTYKDKESDGQRVSLDGLGCLSCIASPPKK